MDRRTAAFGLLLVACIAVAGVTVALAVAGSPEPATSRAASAATTKAVRAATPSRPYTVFRSLDRSRGAESFGLLAVRGADGKVRPTGMQCERVYAVRSAGICLARGRSLTGAYEARLLGRDLQVRRTIKISGVPSRARISADGRYASSTTFVSGHSYAKPGTFSTQTTLYDMRRGKRIADLETFAFRDHGKVLDAPDVNLWGVTFAKDSDRFYATLATGNKTHLIEGSVSARTGNVIHDNVECPSLSPDGTRIGFKKLVGKNPAVWHFTVLDLATGKGTPLAEDRPIDDQLEWLDDKNVLYRSGEEVWTVPADGTGTPRRYLPQADSPAIVR